MAKKKAVKKINKSAIDGRFATEKDLGEHPDTTYKQTVHPKPKKKQPKKDS